MKKILIIVGVIILVAGSVLVYRWFAPREQTDPFTIVPEDAVLILETSQMYTAWEEFQDKKVWQSLKRIPAISSLQNKIKAFDSLLVHNEKTEFFKDKKVLVSFHLSSAKESDYLFYIPVNSSKEENFLRNTFKKLENNEKYVLESRDYKDYTIQSIRSKDNSQSISYFVYKNYFIACFSESLLESVINRLENKKTNFLFWRKESSGIKKLVEGKTSLYLRYDKIEDLFSRFSDSQLLKPLSSFADKSVLEVNLDDKELLLNGFTYSANEKNSFIQCFRTQKPQAFLLKNYIPASASSVYYYGFNDGGSLRKSFEKYWSTQNPSYLEEVETINKKFKIDIASLYTNFNKEIGLCNLDSDASSLDKLVFVYSDNSEKLFAELNKVALASGKGSAPLSTETWERKKIIEIGIEEFPSKVFGKIFQGFPKCYFTTIDNYVVFSNNKQNIKNLVKDIEGDNVWGKTIAVNSFLEETITEFNVGVFVNISTMWRALLNEVSPEFKDELLKNEKLIQGFDLLAIQYSHINETILTNMVITHDLTVPDYDEETSAPIVFDGKLSPQMNLVENKNRTKDVLVQDSLTNIYLLGNDIAIKWKYLLNEQINSEVLSIDIKKDKSWEYLFSSGNKIYALDSRGKLVNKFPFVLPDQIENISVLDYDNNKDYRVAASDKNGNVYIYNLAGQNLEGWTPKSFTGKVFEKVKHLRIANKDYILVIQENGTINLTNRKGEMQAGFPLQLKKAQIISYVQQKGRDLESTEFIVQHADKSLTSFNLNGKITQRSEATDYLISDNRRQSFVWLKTQQNSSLVIYDQENEVKIPFKVTSLKYYNFSSKGEFVIATDKARRILSLYDKKGVELIKSVESDGHSDVYFDEKTKVFKVYNLFNNKIDLIEF